MKTIQYLFLAAISLAGWHCQSASDHSPQVATDSLALEDINPIFMPDIYSDQQLISFLDSIGKVDAKGWAEQAKQSSDADYKDLHWDGKKDFSTQTILQFKKGMAGGEIPTEFARQWLPDLDSQWLAKPRIPLHLHFGKVNDPAGLWIFSLGNEAELDWDATVYFLSSKGLLAHRKISHRYGLDQVQSFKGPQGDRIVHFRINYESGTGVWRWNEYYYSLNQDTLFPVLNHLQNSNWAQYSTRGWWWETTEVSKDPLRLKLVAKITLPDTSVETHYFFADSTLVEPAWNPTSSQYEWPFHPPVWTETRMMSFVHGEFSELFFMAGFGDQLKEGLKSEDPAERFRIRNYLQYVVYSLRHPSE